MDIFLYRINESTPKDILANSEGTFIHHFEPATEKVSHIQDALPLPVGSFTKRASLFLIAISRRFAGRFRSLFRLWVRSEKGLLPKEVLQRTSTIMNGGRYKALIGIDKGGLLWAGTMARLHQSPTVASMNSDK